MTRLSHRAREFQPFHAMAVAAKAGRLAEQGAEVIRPVLTSRRRQSTASAQRFAFLWARPASRTTSSAASALTFRRA